MTTTAFNEMQWRPGMSVVYKFRNVDAPNGESIRRTPVNGVEFNGKDNGGGIYGVDLKGNRIFVHHASILDVQFGFKGGTR